MKRFIALTCSALARSVYAAAAKASPVVTVQLYDQGLHNTPKKLRHTLQGEIDAVPPGEYDAILLVYGMCGTSTLGLEARHTPVVMPRAHDCITLYLGSMQRYQTEFDAHPGTYWYSQDYLERNAPGSNVALGATNIGVMDEVYEEYVRKYGQDNADYLMEVMGAWGEHYDRAAFIDTGLTNSDSFEEVAREQAKRRGWLFERKLGNWQLIEKLINGDWPDDEFLVAPPGHRIVQASDARLIKIEAADKAG